MRTRTRHLLLAAGLIPALAAATQAHDPAAPVPPPSYTALPAPASETFMGDEDWRQSNDAVGTLTRGHMDVLSWEAQNMPAGAGPAVPQGEPLTPAEALRIALLNRPGLFITEEVGGQARIEADIAVIEFSRDVHRAWIIAVAAQQGLHQTEQVFESADLSIELATRMTRVGNWGQDRFLRQQLAHADAAIALAQARQEAASTREQLVRKMGLWGESARITFPDSLPALPDSPVASEDLEATALRQHPRMAWLAQDAELARRGMSSRSVDAWNEAARAAVTTSLSAGNGADDPMGSLITSAPVLEYRRLPANNQAGEAAQAQ
ncbi:MAG TPA: TolC family protein, partial [Thioalkalivibrio sp.]|nr:TolC family protein [Thioalkalivibrio sp.]